MATLILFGPTGAGKTYIGKLLQKEFGWYFYDGDSDLTPEMKKALNSMKVITDKMRQKFITRVINTTVKLASQHNHIAVAQTFIKDKYRRRLLKKLPLARFVLIKTQEERRHERRRQRADYPWDESYVKKMDSIFEAPRIPHQIITNHNDGSNNLRSDLRRLLSRLF